MIPGGLTKILRPLDISVNKSFKCKSRELWENWMIESEHLIIKTKRMIKATHSIIVLWIKDPWDIVDHITIINKIVEKCLDNTKQNLSAWGS